MRDELLDFEDFVLKIKKLNITKNFKDKLLEDVKQINNWNMLINVVCYLERAEIDFNEPSK